MLQTAREIAGNRVVVAMTLLAGASSFVVGNAYQAQMPEFAADLGHDHADFHYTMLFAANAAGALAAGLFLETFNLLQARPKIAGILVVILWCLCIGGFAVSDNFALSFALLFAAGFLNLAFSAMTQTLVQLHAPNHMRGRVIGLYNMCFHGMRAFSGVTVGMAGSADRRPLVAGAERGRAAGDRDRAAALRDAAAAGAGGIGGGSGDRRWRRCLGASAAKSGNVSADPFHQPQHTPEPAGSKKHVLQDQPRRHRQRGLRAARAVLSGLLRHEDLRQDPARAAR